ncbi:hypothetical protein ART_3384 [Arthrobacter sp. PAMC 25486]|nr:hypothetical protein ART_3384 [Arthrobacter sp. PAMC 25486]
MAYPALAVKEQTRRAGHHHRRHHRSLAREFHPGDAGPAEIPDAIE